MLSFKKSMQTLLIVMIIAIFSLTSSAVLATSEPHKLVIQVSTNDPLTHKIALNNAVNLQKHFGMDNIIVEIVAYGPGLNLLTPKSKEASRVKSLAMQDIKFSACGNTMKKMEKKSGKPVALTEGVDTVPAGVVRIMELQQEGYAYIRP